MFLSAAVGNKEELWVNINWSISSPCLACLTVRALCNANLKDLVCTDILLVIDWAEVPGMFEFDGTLYIDMDTGHRRQEDLTLVRS